MQIKNILVFTGYFLAISSEDPEDCGRDRSGGHKNGNRIVGGTETEEQEFPWMVMLTVDVVQKPGYTELCGGTILNRYYILTAGHCVFQAGTVVSADNMRVHLEKHSRTSGGVRVRVQRVDLHYLYNDETMKYDIALLKLKSPLIFSDKVGPICLTKNKHYMKRHTKVMAIGWGQLDYTSKSPSKTLQKVILNLYPTWKCKNKYKEADVEMQVSRSHNLCTLNKDGRDACVGDSGGPLVYKEHGKYVQVGITSWGMGCADPRYPGVWTDVISLKQWIADDMERDGRDNDILFRLEVEVGEEVCEEVGGQEVCLEPNGEVKVKNSAMDPQFSLTLLSFIALISWSL